MRNLMKQNKAITLIALVITIIVLLILAGVTIQTLTGDNGLLQKAQTAKEENEDAKELELIKLAVSAAQVEGKGILTRDNLYNELSKLKNIEELAESDLGFYYEGNKNYRIYKDGRIEESLLPKEYQQVEYIESSGTQFINTLYNPSNKTNIEIEVEITESQYNVELFGTRNNNIYYEVLYYGSPMMHFQFGSSTPRFSYKFAESKDFYKVENGNLYINGVLMCKLDSIEFNSIINSLYLMGLNNNGIAERRIKCKFYSCVISEKNIKKRNYIPCYSTTTVIDVDGKEYSAGTIGLYDTIEGKFYVNKGTGTFGYGMEDGTYVAPTNN